MKTKLLKKLRRMADKAVTVKPFVGEIGGGYLRGTLLDGDSIELRDLPFTTIMSPPQKKQCYFTFRSGMSLWEKS